MQVVVELVASVNWLFVLYNVSDVLHNDLEVAGVELSDTFIPEVFYSPRWFRIWTASIANGYLPADFRWPNIKEVARTIKAGIEKQLEVRAFEVCSRAAPHAEHGINFKFRFPTEGFDDVGDFDVLAYWPQSNQWLIVECKYNQPPFCLKDARRLRERIFGIAPDRGQFSKIEGRRSFLVLNVERLRELLGWPAPMPGIAASISEIYVSRQIYWWMRYPPLEVPTDFVRIDALDSWLRSNNKIGGKTARAGDPP
jgi:hypothetical protein